MKSIFKFICCGNVDDGKSTLIGRLLIDTNNVKKDQLDDALKASKKNGSNKIELAMLLDGLLSEREQQITIDIAHRFFDYKDIRFHILDCPGHEQYTKNMAIAAASVDTAIVVIDSLRGIKPQTLKHIEICDLFQVKNLLICLTKTDLLTNQEGQVDLTKINSLEKEIKDILSQYSFNYDILPVSAVTGFNTDFILKFLYKKAQKQFEEKEKNTKMIMHILASKLYNGKRYYFSKNTTFPRTKSDTKSTIYPQNTPVTIERFFENNSFTIKEDVDISKGDCLSNASVFVSNKIMHSSFFFEKKTASMLFRHGTNIRRVVNLTPTQLELDGPIVFNNINEVKENGFGIFIDEMTKKTIGCAVFKNNKNTTSPIQTHLNYIICGGSSASRQKKATELREKFSPQPVILDSSKLNAILNTKKEEDLPLLANYLNEQGFSTICLVDKTATKRQKESIYIQLDEE